MSDGSPAARRPRFLADAMLGTLARWLRLFGYDCLYLGGADDAHLARLAREEERWLLTRDRELAAVGPRSLLIRAETLEDQLVEVLGRLQLRPDPSLQSARCAECNGGLEDVQRHEVTEEVPPHVHATAERFRRCSSCGRVYWPGTHGDRIRRRMERVVGRAAGPDG